MVVMVSPKGTCEFVADALIPTYRSRGYVMEGEEQETASPDAEQSMEDAPSDEKGQEPAPEEGAVDPLDETVPEVYVCPVCGKEYKTESGYRDHMKSKHPEI